MLAKVIVQKSMLFLAVALACALNPVNASYCRDCEEEIWEEVPCSIVPTTTTTVAPPTTAPYTTLPPITIDPITPSTTIAPPLIITNPPVPPTSTLSNSFQKCYCQCKAGCREFCRKVEMNPNAQKQITQISRSAKNAPGGGLVEVKHVHQRKFKPLKYNMPYIPGNGVPEEQPSPCAADNSIEDENYGVPVTTPPPAIIPLPLPQPKPYQYPQPNPLPPIHGYPQPLPLPPVHYDELPQNPSRSPYNADTYLDSTGYSIDELTKMLSIPSYSIPGSVSQYSPHQPSPTELYGQMPNSYGSSAWAAAATPSGVKTSISRYPSKPELTGNDYDNSIQYAAPPSDTGNYLSKYIGNTIPSSKSYDSNSNPSPY